MQDIARDLKVSVVTVSKVLRNQGKISAATRKRVLQRAKQLNYQANWVARSLVTRRTYTIGLLLPDFTHSFFAEIARSIAESVRPHGYHVLISYFEENAELEKSEMDALVARQVDGLIVASAQSPPDKKFFGELFKRKLPVVLIDRPLAGVRASFVGVNNQEVGRIATDHLIEQGCRKLAHLKGPDNGIARERQNGFRRALEAQGITFNPRNVIPASYDDATGYEAMQKLLRSRSVPDGVFCYNDPVAIGAMKAILDEGLDIPGDIAVVGAGNVHYSDMLPVPLTTVDQDTTATGREAAALVIQRIESKRTLQPARKLLTPRLVVRKSSLRSDSSGNSSGKHMTNSSEE